MFAKLLDRSYHNALGLSSHNDQKGHKFTIMAAPYPNRIEFTAGQTFLDQVVWCQGARTYAEVHTVETGLPTRLKAIAHGIPLNLVIPVWFENFKATKPILRPGVAYYAFAIDADNLELVDDNSDDASISKYGVMYYLPPVDLSTYQIRAHFKKNTSSPSLLEISSEDIVPAFELVNPGLIRLELTPAQTRTLIGNSKAPISGIAHVELYNDDGQVFILWSYEWTVYPEGTTE